MFIIVFFTITGFKIIDEKGRRVLYNFKYGEEFKIHKRI
jgi:hypothetical protein